MAKVTNLVLYAHDGGAETRRPLASFSPELSPLEMAAKVNAATSREFGQADQAGRPHPRLKLVRETREADEQKKLSFVEYCECDAGGADSGKPVSEIEALFPKEQ